MISLMSMRVFLVVPLLFFGGCAEIDPPYMQGRWNSPNSNQRNLVLQVASPSDIFNGRHDADYDAKQVTDAVHRFRDGKTKTIERLQVTNVANSQSNGGTGQ